MSWLDVVPTVTLLLPLLVRLMVYCRPTWADFSRGLIYTAMNV